MYETGKIKESKGQHLAEILSQHGGKDDVEFKQELMRKYSKDIYKMSRQDFLMSQIDLDPIESNYSAEQKQQSIQAMTHANNMITSGGHL